jgi:putative transposase
LRPVYTAPTEAAAKARFDEFADVWGQKYPAIIRLWTTAWAEFVPFLAYGARAPLRTADRISRRPPA